MSTNLDSIIEKLELRMKRMITFLPPKRRLYFDDLINSFTSRGILLCGARGTGKTTFLLIMAKKKQFFYVSADDPLLLQCPVYELFQKILTDYPGIIIDEVHFLKDWSILVKSLYDAFPNRFIWLSDSSSIRIRKGIADLSRRFVIINLPLMSLREYIYFETEKKLPKIDNLFDSRSMEVCVKILNQLDVLKYFKSYREHGTRPFYIEGNFKERLINVIEKSIYYDIPYFIDRVSENHLGAMRAVISHIAYSKIPKINVEAMCRDWNISKTKFYELLYAMENVELINIIEKEGTKKAYTKGAKIFFADPTMYYVLEGNLGNVREAFVAFVLKNRGKFWAEKDDRKGDFVFNGIRLEIGGTSKKPKEAHFVIRDDVDIPFKNVIPMWALGMLW